MHRRKPSTQLRGLRPAMLLCKIGIALVACDRAPSPVNAGSPAGVTATASAQSPPTPAAAPPPVPAPVAAPVAAPPRADSAPPRAGAARTPAPSNGMRSTLAGVYTEAQAKRGAELYTELCASCHMALGNHEGPVFRTSWGGVAASEMLTYLSSSMPKNDPGSLTTGQYVLLMAYLFQLNGMPAGATPLPADEGALKQIRIDTTGSGQRAAGNR